MALSAIDAIGPAFEHTRQQLLKPFRMSQWAKLALVGFLAGELSSTGCPSSNFSGFQQPRHGRQQVFSAAFPDMGAAGLPHINPALMVTLILIGLAVFVVVWLVFIYLNSMMRFVLFDSVIARRCEIRASWRRRQSAAWELFVWQLVVGGLTLVAMAILLGIPLFMAASLGWLTQPKMHLAPLILGGILIFFAFLGLVLALLIVHLFTKDFVVPQMALEDFSATDGWRHLLAFVRADKWGFAGYVGMKVVLGVGAAVIFGIAGLMVALILLIPAGGVGIVAVMMAKTAGVGWTLYTITAAVVAGCILLFILLYLMSLISVPGIVFFPAYSLYFFAGRYPRLQMLLYPMPSPPAPPLLDSPI